MRHLRSPSGQRALAAFARRRLLVALDFDGTLAPLVTDPHDARLPPATRRALHRVATRFPCVVISGRAREDVLGRLGRIPLAQVIGNHGIEPSPAARAAARHVARWKRQLQKALGGEQRVTIEDKRYSLAVHFRKAVVKARARKAILDAAAALGHARVVQGKLVVNLVPADAPHKGTALQETRRRLGCEAAIYVGDDDTDEDAFASGDRRTLLAVRVGRRARSAARFYLEHPGEVAALLLQLAAPGDYEGRSEK
jgi:trehalose 6-phosphate phosphatase